MNYRSIIRFSIFLIIVEIASNILVQLNFLPNMAKVSGLKTSKHYKYQWQDWRSEKEAWGGWHKSNTISRHSKECLDITYKSNSYGARDDEFKSSVKNKIILLGDSFAEGYGIDKEKTLDRLLEKRTKYDILNFGSAHNNGPVQYYILYNKLASKFDHKKIIDYPTTQQQK